MGDTSQVYNSLFLPPPCSHAGNGKHFFLRNRWCGLVMELQSGLAEPGSEVITAYRTPNATMGDHQLFYEDEQTGTIRTAVNGYCLDAQGHFKSLKLCMLFHVPMLKICGQNAWGA